MNSARKTAAELNGIDESNDDFDSVWERKFGDTDRVLIMSAEDTIKQLQEMSEMC